jgi:hypothetical protein
MGLSCEGLVHLLYRLAAVQNIEKRSTLLKIDITAVHLFHMQIFNALNSLDLKSLEEPRYLLGEFVKQPLACLTLGEPTTQFSS